MSKYTKKNTTRKSHKHINGTDLFWYAVQTSTIRKFTDLTNNPAMCIESSNYEGVETTKEATLKQVSYAIHKLPPLSDNDIELVALRLEEQGIKVSIEKGETCVNILKDIFKERRAEEHERIIATDNEFEKTMNPEIVEILSKYNPSVQKIFFSMIESPDAIEELQCLSKAYDKSVELFRNSKEQSKRTLIMDLLRRTYVVSFEELATLLSIETSEITCLFRGKNALKKKANMFMNKSRIKRELRSVAKNQNMLPEELAKPKMVKQEKTVNSSKKQVKSKEKGLKEEAKQQKELVESEDEKPEKEANQPKKLAKFEEEKPEKEVKQPEELAKSKEEKPEKEAKQPEELAKSKEEKPEKEAKQPKELVKSEEEKPEKEVKQPEELAKSEEEKPDKEAKQPKELVKSEEEKPEKEVKQPEELAKSEEEKPEKEAKQHKKLVKCEDEKTRKEAKLSKETYVLGQVCVKDETKHNSSKGQKETWQKVYDIRDDVASWASHISQTTQPSHVLLDTNILVNSKLREYVKNNFQRGNISMISILELRKLLRSKNDLAMRALTKLMKSVNNQVFYEPLGDTDADLTGDCDIRLAELSKKNNLTFVTEDMGAAVYAWAIGCPCRYLRIDPISVNAYSNSTMNRTAIVDVDIRLRKLSNKLHSMFSHVIITELFARNLNSNKLNQEKVVKILQEDICTDTDGFYEPYCMNVDLSKYELALINICKDRGAVLVSSNPATLALAWEYGVKTFYYY